MKKPIVGILLLCLAALLFFASREYLSLAYLQQNFLEIQNYKFENELKFAVIFFLMYVIVIAFSIPGSIFLSIAAGAFFGISKGVVMASFASSLGATLAFLSSRYLLRDWVREKYGSTFQKVDTRFQREGPFYLVSLRLIATIPFFLVNILMGLTSISVLSFYFFSQLGMLPLAFIYVQAGSELSKMQSLEDLLSWKLIGILAALAVLPWLLKWLLQRKQTAEL